MGTCFRDPRQTPEDQLWEQPPANTVIVLLGDLSKVLLIGGAEGSLMAFTHNKKLVRQMIGRLYDLSKKKF